MSKLTRAWGTAKLALSEKSPTLLVVGGVVAMGSAVVIAARNSLNNSHKFQEIVDRDRQIDENDKDARFEASARPLASLMVETYGVPTVLFVGGAAMTFKGHSIMQDRNTQLAVAFTATKKAFDAYRQRVVQAHGHEWDQALMNGHSHRKDSLRGDKVAVRDWEQSARDPYNRVFSHETTSRWENDLGTNKHFIACQQRFAQQLLNRQGYVYLSDIYKSLGFPESDISRVVGWKIDTLPDGTRSIPVIDFGLDKSLPDDWKYNENKAVYLDFNCQGLIVGGKVQKLLEKG